MNILIITHFYKPEIGAGSVRIQYFQQALTTAGHKVRIVAPIPNYPFGKVYNGYINKKTINEIESVVYLPIYIPTQHSLISRGISYLSFFLKSIFYSIFDKSKPELIITSSPPIFTALAAVLISKIKRIPIIVDLRDIWPDIGVELGLIKKRIILQILRKIESYILKNATVLIVTAEGDRRNLLEKKVDYEKIFIIYNGADTNLFVPLNEFEKEKTRKAYNLPIDKKLLIYFGSFNYGMNDTELLGLVFDNLEKVKDKFLLVIVGHGENFNDFILKIRNKINFIHIDSLQSNVLSKIVAASDLSLIPRKKLNKNTGGNIPVKCFESWAAGIPVLISTDVDSEINRIFSECSVGYLVESENIEAYTKAIVDFLSKPNNELDVKSAREYVIQNFDRKVQAEKIIQIIESNFIKV